MSAETLDTLYAEYWASPRSVPSPDGLVAGVRSEALRLTRDEDVAQNVCIVVLDKLETFVRSDATGFSKWVNSIIRRTRLDAYRTSSDHTQVFDEDAGQSPTDDGYVDTSRLPNGIRIVADKLLQGHSLVEIAGQLNISSAALRNRLSRFRKTALRNAPSKALVSRHQD
jgi:DNA-directed RNA polymerase specialized sigma24 family protein